MQYSSNRERAAVRCQCAAVATRKTNHSEMGHHHPRLAALKSLRRSVIRPPPQTVTPTRNEADMRHTTISCSRGGGAVGGLRPCWSISLPPGLAAMRQERLVTRLDHHFLKTSADVASDDVGFIETAQPRPIAIGCSFSARTGRAIGARHDVCADSIRAIGFHDRFGDGWWRRGGHRHCLRDFQYGCPRRHRCQAWPAATCENYRGSSDSSLVSPH